MSKLFRIIFLLAISSMYLTAQDVRTGPDAYWTSNKTWKSPLTTARLIESSLVASGLSDGRLNKYTNIYKKVLENFKKDLGPEFKKLSKYEQGDYILNWAHKNILNHYSEKQTLMDILIDTGNYNCVSSAIFYQLLSKEAGLRVETIETSDHAFCSVKTDKGWVDVETTTVYGFDPGVKKEFQKSFNQTGYSYVPPGNYRNRKKINDKETVSLILQNRIALLQEHNFHDKAVGLAIDRWTLWENEKTRKDMNNSFRNWSAILNNRGSYKEAFEFLSAVSKKYDLIENKDLLYNLAYNLVVTMTKEKNYIGSKSFLSSTDNILNVQDRLKLKKLITREELADIVKNGSYNDSLPLVRQAYKTKDISKSDWQNWITVLHQKKALLIAQDIGWWNAWQFLIGLPLEEQALPTMKNSLSRAHDNWSFEIHNQYADLVNSGKSEAAKQLLLKELEKDPNNKYLLKDLSDLKKIQADNS